MLTAVRMRGMDQRPGARLWLLQRPRLQQRLDDDVHRQGGELLRIGTRRMRLCFYKYPVMVRMVLLKGPNLKER